MSAAEFIVGACNVWLILGCLVAIVFLAYGADRILEDARGVYLFRVLVAPGVVLLWPVVLWRWYAREKDTIAWQDHHSPRRSLAGWLELIMSFSLVALLVVAAAYVGPPEDSPEPVKLSELHMRAKSQA